MEKSLDACPLCQCPVINPLDPKNYERLGPVGVDRFDRITERRFISAVMTVILIFAALICLTIDLVYFQKMTWSTVALGSMGVAWVCVALPLWPKRIGLRRAFAIDAVALLLFLWLVEKQISQSDWLYTLALPIVVTITLVVVGVATLGKNGRVQGWRLAGVILFGCGLIAMGVDAAVHWHTAGHMYVTWSWLVIIPCAAAAAVTFIIARKHRFQAALARRFHI